MDPNEKNAPSAPNETNAPKETKADFSVNKAKSLLKEQAGEIKQTATFNRAESLYVFENGEWVWSLKAAQKRKRPFVSVMVKDL